MVASDPDKAGAIRIDGDFDPFTLDVIKNRLASIADEMALTVARTARSFIVKEALDYSTALFASDGEFIAQGTCLPLHLGSMPSALEAVVRTFGNDLAPGDIFALNDPYDGGTHLPDIIAVKPVFDDQVLLGYASCIAHQTDMGGRVPGSMACDSTEIYQEGLRLPPLRLYQAGEPVATIFRIIERNVRVPDKVLGDIHSQIAACRIGERGLMELVERYGLEQFQGYCRELLDYTERYTRSQIADLPDGAFDFTDHIDGDGIEPGAITIQVKVTVAGDTMTIDFAGTSPQVKGAINSVHSFTASAAWACVRSIFDNDIPNNAGYFRPIRVLTPEGSIVNPRPPAAVAARGLTGDRVADTVFGALAQLLPDRVPASGPHAPDTAVSFGGYYADGKPFVYIEGLVGSWGGGPDRDGMDASTGTIVNYSNTPAELLEVEQPLVIERYALVPDSGGPGRYRGGLALERHIRFLADEAVLQVRSDRHDFAPYGLNGGLPGAHARLRLIRADGTVEEFFSQFLATVRKGDVLEVGLASGGGHGDPLEREPQRVLHDVIEGKVTVPHAADAYGVVIAGEPPMILAAETAALRARQQRQRDP
ncbi:MAG: hydantoinase B/oxoprolinase family protein [Alphaproteobacteria bacterium]|jgi:N-methylhydantoinase B|nr:hydantoinase B/oxoprolinase family protein [Alphaproteobacteria bacterium]MDP6564635.1 hydantoinase B/oxoprolinase family protein [Alphaproteobacteria bacterium]MDP6815614.1 hydantoinase B/oxoprolinase family protein [Alphaproteobacteria bacterium]